MGDVACCLTGGPGDGVVPMPGRRRSSSSPNTPGVTGAGLDGHHLIPEVLAGRRFVDGIIDSRAGAA